MDKEEKEKLRKKLFSFGCGNWDGELVLLTPALFEKVPDGTMLHSISDDTAIKGQDVIDDDTRFGCLAFGVKSDQYKEAITWFEGKQFIE